jgi:hypothetical protein
MDFILPKLKRKYKLLKETLKIKAKKTRDSKLIINRNKVRNVSLSHNKFLTPSVTLKQKKKIFINKDIK